MSSPDRPDRNRAASLLLLAPATLTFAFDVAYRGGSLAHFRPRDWAAYALSLSVSGALWGSALSALARRGRAGLAVGAASVLLAAALFGGQRYFFLQYGTFLNRDAAFFGATFGETVRRLMLAEWRGMLRAHLAPLLAASALAALAFRLRPAARPLSPWLLAPSLLGAMFLPWSFRGAQACSPDVIYLHAVGGLLAARLGASTDSNHALPGARMPEFLPEVSARPARPRNLIFILNESVRADIVCSAHQESCPNAPFSNEAAPRRMPLTQLRANDSSTTISVAVTLTGVAPNADRDQMHRAPTLWEFARAAGHDTAYWTSQDLRGIHSDMFVREVGARVQVAGYDLDPQCDVDVGADDRLLARRVERDLASLREPFVAVIHLANTHFPYLVDPRKSPFQPSEETKDPDKNTDYFNFYRNSVYLQDEALGDIIRAVHAAPSGPRTIIAYTSDHGEAFREHHQLAHSLSIYDEEIHVPGWIDAPDGALSEAERSALASLRDVPVWQVDLLPTFLDLLGLWDAPEIARFRARMAGASWLRPADPSRVVALTNCTAVWGCPFRNWGLMRGPLKLEARAWDPDWHCFNVLDDPLERRDLGSAACGDLAKRAIDLFGEKPGGR